jgi:hypothetical protein
LAATAEGERLVDKMFTGEIDLGQLPLLERRESAWLGSLVLLLRNSEEGRDRLRSLLAVGRERYRDFLMAAARAIEEAAPDQQLQVTDGLIHAGRVCQEYLYLTMVTATPARLVGGPPRSEAGLVFQAWLMDQLRKHQWNFVISPPDPPGLSTRLLEAAMDACGQAGYHLHSGWLWESLTSSMRHEEMPRELLAAMDRHGEAMAARWPEARREGNILRHRAWAEAALRQAAAGPSEGPR